ncbi:MAG TPA: DinB family protein, partial [Phycisphaerae bacterium]
MDEKSILLNQLEITRQMTLSLLETIEKSGADVQQALTWQPGPGRAHIGWQLMHIAATDDRYLNFRLLGKPVERVDDPALVNTFGGGSTPT